MLKDRPRRCNARNRRTDAALHRAEREGRLTKYLRSSRFCRNWAVRARKRCRLHGGLSTGPKTSEGKARSVAAMVEGRRRLLEKLKAEGKPVPWGRKKGGVNRSAGGVFGPEHRSFVGAEHSPARKQTLASTEGLSWISR
jgi:hypothetical protein